MALFTVIIIDNQCSVKLSGSDMFFSDSLSDKESRL